MIHDVQKSYYRDILTILKRYKLFIYGETLRVDGASVSYIERGACLSAYIIIRVCFLLLDEDHFSSYAYQLRLFYFNLFVKHYSYMFLEIIIHY